MRARYRVDKSCRVPCGPNSRSARSWGTRRIVGLHQAARPRRRGRPRHRPPRRRGRWQAPARAGAVGRLAPADRPNSSRCRQPPVSGRPAATGATRRPQHRQAVRDIPGKNQMRVGADEPADRVLLGEPGDLPGQPSRVAGQQEMPAGHPREVRGRTGGASPLGHRRRAVRVLVSRERGDRNGQRVIGPALIARYQGEVSPRRVGADASVTTDPARG